jgi:hypothetical protein
MENTIWGLKGFIQQTITSFEDLAQLGTQHFKNIFSAERRVTIDAIIQLALCFPSFVGRGRQQGSNGGSI